MKRLFATTLAGVALAATLAACGGSSSSSSTAASASWASSTAAAAAQSNIVQTAVAAGEFKTLVSLVKQAGLAGALSGPGPLTVFAPTDAAFAAVPKATLAELAKNPAKLKAVLLYHVVKGNVTAAQVIKLKSAKTLEGGSVPIRVSSGKVYVGDAQVTKTNVVTSNGVIHVINRVLIPAS
ncbi:MAG TPA: fasciclin domain-containing protein [Solirubrobacteraceae bacterium]|nr:fasciclin domain-containing protein [Solirubrobacteraceae bacterium]